MSFKKELLTAYGGFRTGLGRVGTRPLGCEETEFCIRAIQARPDKILLYKPSASVAHRVPAMRARWRYFLSRCYCEGLSKAHMKQFVGSKDGLASEWQYTLSILPGGVVRGLTDTLLRADPAGISRAAFIGAGLLSTTLGYLAGQLTGRRVCRGIRELTAGAGAGGTFPATPNFSPIHIEEVEIGAPLPALAGSSASEGRHRRVLSLVRLHDSPLGLVDLTRGEEGVDAEAYASEIWRSLGPRIEAHLQADCLAAVTELGAGGIASPSQPNCLAERAAFKSSAPFASVVVATRDRPESLRRCLESLLEMDYPHFEIVVVDSAPSTNASAALLEERFGECQQIRYLRESRPGLAIAHNRALMAINSDIVAFTDDDVIVDALWLLQLVKAFAVSENSACVTGLILPRELETPAQLWVEQYANFNKGFSQRLFDLKDNRPNDPLYPFSAGVFGSGANMAFKTAVLREIGGFDPALGAGSGGRGGDDLAAFFDVVTSGYAIVYEPAAINWHQHRREYAGLRKQIYGYGVGLTAYLTKTLMDRPGHILEFAARVPRGLIYTMDSRSAKNVRKSADYPRELTSAERKGMLYGPIAYLGSRWRARYTKPRFDCPDSAH
jgi:GT2 family glycosyltransferase